MFSEVSVAPALLAYLEHRRERQRQRERHATAVRIVVWELRSNGAELVMQAAGRNATREPGPRATIPYPATSMA